MSTMKGKEQDMTAGGTDHPPEFGKLIYYEVTSRRRPGPANLFIEQPWTEPIQALRLHHPTKTWTFDPETVWGSRMDDFDKCEDRIHRVDRARAEELAHLFEAPLPDEDALRRLMQDGAERGDGPSKPGEA